MDVTQNISSSSPPNTSSIEEGIVKAAQKDTQAFEKIYDKYYEPIFRYIYQRVSGKDEANDITSKTFLKAMTNINSFELKGFPFSSWLYRIASNELNNYYRENKESPTLNVNHDSLTLLSDDVKHEAKEINSDVLLKVLSDLSEGDLPFIEMKYLEQRSFKEIGEILGITENNAKVKTHRIIKKIKKNI
jgi:RNA polymerase sigma-70 factor (ECF subfamily)